MLELERKPLDQIYKDWDKEDREIKAKFQQHCAAMHELETAELASQSLIERLSHETQTLERRQGELDKFIRNNIDTQGALATELDDMEKKLDEMLLQKESAAQQAQLPKASDATSRRGEMYEEALALDRQVDTMSRQMVDIVERLNRSTAEQSTADSTVSKVEAILNEHYKTLQWVEGESESLRMKLSSFSLV
eukprot:COSAG01_NODE_2987_length_6750_cov_7.311382_6_plen_193_part_00